MIDFDRLFKECIDYGIELTEKYNILDTSFLIGDNNAMMEEFKAFNPLMPEEDINAMISSFRDGVLATVLTRAAHIDGRISRIKYLVAISVHDIVANIRSMNMSYEDTLEYMKILIRHEIGHIIDLNKRYVGTDVEQFVSLMKMEKRIKRKFDKENQGKGPREYLRLYHSMSIERRANREVGITWEDFWKFESRKPGAV